MCCGQNRGTVTRELEKQAAPRSSSIVVAPAAGWSSQSVRYLEKSAIRVRGTVTGKEYEFSAANPVRSVDARDADALLRTRFFARSGE